MRILSFCHIKNLHYDYRIIMQIFIDDKNMTERQYNQHMVILDLQQAIMFKLRFICRV